MSNVGNFLIHSTYPTDKIVWMDEGETITDEYGAFNVNILHTIRTDIFCTGIWTLDDWYSQYNTSTAMHMGQVYSRYSLISSNDSNVLFSGYCMADEINGLAGATLKYRLWGFLNENDTQDLFEQETAGVSSNLFVKDTRLGYPKLFLEGIADARNQTVSVNHNLGFIPFVEIWQQIDDRWYQVDYVDFSSDNSTWTIHNTPQALSFNGEGYTRYKYYYRIYADV